MECVAVFSSNQQQQLLLPRQPGLCGSDAWRTAEAQIRKVQAIGRRDGTKIIATTAAAVGDKTLNPCPTQRRFSLRGHDLRFPIPRPHLLWLEEAQQHISCHGRTRVVGRPVRYAGNSEGVVRSSLDGPAGGTPQPPQRIRGGAQGSLESRIVAFTTPRQYAGRLEALLRDEGAEPLWCPTIVTEQSKETQTEVEKLLLDQQVMIEAHGVAFTSRAGIRAFADALKGRQLLYRDGEERAEESSYPFVVAALGKDAELLQELGLISEVTGARGVSLVVPAVSTPQALVEALGEGRGRKLICPVPLVEEGLQEPPVVPEFLAGLKRRGWDPIRVNSYVTRWLGLDCAQRLLLAPSNEGEAFGQQNSPRLVFKPIDALIFTSTAEIEGLLKSLNGLGPDGALIQALQRGARQFLIASHGPVTALGAERLGLQVDVVGRAFQSFDGIVQALRAELDSVSHNLQTGSWKR